MGERRFGANEGWGLGGDGRAKSRVKKRERETERELKKSELTVEAKKNMAKWLLSKMCLRTCTCREKTYFPSFLLMALATVGARRVWEKRIEVGFRLGPCHGTPLPNLVQGGTNSCGLAMP